MSWRLVISPEVEEDINEAFVWSETKQEGLGHDFLSKVILVWDKLLENPYLNSPRSKTRDIRWRYIQKFPYRIIYQIDETPKIIIVAAVLHGAKQDWYWQKRLI